MKKRPNPFDPLRIKAQMQVDRAPAPETDTHTPEQLLHELRVHQVELEMQNESLRQTQLELEESRDRYVDLYDFAPIGYLSLDAVGLITDMNLTSATLLGGERRKLLRRLFSMQVAAADRKRWHQFFINMLKMDDAQICELSLKRHEGTTFPVQINCKRLSHSAEPQFRIAFFDITERKRTDDELRLAAIVFEAQEGMIVTDANAVILRVNHAFTQLTGYSPGEAVGNTPAMLHSGRQDQAFYQQLWRTLKQEHRWQGEIWNKHKNGKIFAEWLTISEVGSLDGKMVRYVGTFSDITHNKEAEAEIHRLAYYDALTGLPNRRLLYDRLGQALAASKRRGHHGAVLFLDLDNFKILNDTRGHDVGDLMLVEVARRLGDAMREGDTIARLGGDEFVVLLEDLSQDEREAVIQAGLVGEKIHEITQASYLIRDIEYTGTTSIGISLFCGNEVSVDDLMKHADLAMYQAKKDGRNSLRFFDPAIQAALSEYSTLEGQLRHALERQQLQLHYQIQVNTAGQAIGAEALLRWVHPERGMTTPDQFISLAEETGLILPIGLWVLNTACAQIKAWSRHAVTRDLNLAINVSSLQFCQSGFVEQVKQVLFETAINPRQLKFELTESMVLDNVGNAIATMAALKALGIRLSLDDFGTGYSSLSYLKRLPLDQLKIDQSFVRDLATDASDAAVVQAVITMGHTFGMHVIAEGVETEAQRDFLEQHGCDAFQGYLFGRALPVQEFEARLASLG